MIGKILWFLLFVIVIVGIFIYANGWDAFANPLITFWNGLGK